MTDKYIPTGNEKKAVLVYQAGIANVFEVDCFNLANYGRNARRILQGDFRSCEMFARGLAHTGYHVATCYCNMAGDISSFDWETDLENAPFCEHFHPVFNHVARYPLHEIIARHLY